MQKKMHGSGSASSLLPPPLGNGLGNGWWFGDGNHSIPASVMARLAGQEAGAGADVAWLAWSTDAQKKLPPDEIAVCINNPHG